MISKLVAALQHIDAEITAEGIADTLWLALEMKKKSIERSGGANRKSSGDDVTFSGGIQEPLPEKKVNPPPTQPALEPPGPSARTQNRLISSGLYPSSSPGSNGKGKPMSTLPFRSPAGTALPGSREIERILRSFRRRIAFPGKSVLNEEATAKRIAEEGLWIPVLDCASTRWLEVALVVDKGASMTIWRQTILEFHRLLARHGAFRDVRLWELDTNDAGKVCLYAGAGVNIQNRQIRSERELIDTSGRRLILVVSDCVSPAWHSGIVAKTLGEWGYYNAVTIVQVLPQRLWSRTALGMIAPVRLHTSIPGTPNKQLLVRATHYREDGDKAPQQRIAIPIITLEPRPLTAWSRAIARAEDIWIPGFELAIPPLSAKKPKQNGYALYEKAISIPFSSVELVQRFRADASSPARRLAGLLAIVPITLPIIRLVQQAMFHEPRQVHVAEVFLSGLLEIISPNSHTLDPDAVQYDFVDSERVRELLLNSVPPNDSGRVLTEISNFIASRPGHALDFRALLADPLAREGIVIDEENRPFALMGARALRRFGGEYVVLADWLEKEKSKGGEEGDRMGEKAGMYVLERQDERVVVSDEVAQKSFSGGKLVEGIPEAIKTAGAEVIEEDDIIVGDYGQEEVEVGDKEDLQGDAQRESTLQTTKQRDRFTNEDELAPAEKPEMPISGFGRPVEVLMSRDFDLSFQQLPSQKREIVRRKIDYLAANPAHSSLNAHRLKQADGDIWDCYIDQGMRLLYELQGDTLRLWYLGGHAIIDHVQRLSFNQQAKFLSWLMPEDNVAAPATPASIPAYRDGQSYAAASRQPDAVSGTSNAFTYFREAYLQMLGVPGELVQAVKDAPTLDDVLALPGLPERARNQLLDVATSPKMKTVLLDPSQLLYRTRLDRLDGYFEGRIKKLMLNLEDDQQQYIDLTHIPLLLLKGTAGCGKTTIGIYRAIRLAEEGRRVLVVTYNKTLASVTCTLIEELVGPLPANLEVKTASSVMVSLLGPRLTIPSGKQAYLPRQFLQQALAEVRLTDKTQVLTRPESFFIAEIQGVIKGLGLTSVEAYKAIRRYGRKTALGPAQREAVWKVYEAYQKRMEAARIHEWSDAALLALEQAKNGPLSKMYDDIIVDEAQDLNPVDLRVIQALVAPQGTLMVLGDAAQTLYSRGFSWVQAGISARGRTSILRVNHRTTRQIAEAASQLIMNNTLMRSSNEYVDPQWTRRTGEMPRLLTSATRHKQIDVIYQQILALLNTQQCRLADLAVLCPDDRTCELCKDIFVGNGLRAVLRTDPDFDILEEQIKVMTIHSAKGLEFPVVFLTHLNEGDLPCFEQSAQDEEEAQLEIERSRMLCYVGMTRAADLLYLVTVRGQESRFVRELAGKIEIE